MAKFTFTFSRNCMYAMEISAKDEDAAEEKFWKTVEKLSEKELLEIADDFGDIEIESIE